MKPTSADLWLWERVQSRDVPSWARALDASRALKTLAGPSRAQRIAESVHLAINAHAGATSRSRTLHNALALLHLIRGNNARGLNAETGNTLQGYMHFRAYVTPDAERAKHYRRWLRRMDRK